MKKLFENLKNHKYQFISVSGYENAEGEVSNYVVNTGVSYESLVKKDIDKLKSAFYDEQIMEQARIELLSSLEKNADPKTRSIQSQAQLDAYEPLCDGMRLHKSSGNVFIQGYRVNKTVIKAGVYKEKNSRPLTIAKGKVEKDLKLSTPRYRQFSIGKMDSLKMQGKEYVFVNNIGSFISFLKEGEIKSEE